MSDGYATRLDTLDFTGALDQAWELVRALNRFVEERAPWKLAKSDEPERSRASTRRCARSPTAAACSASCCTRSCPATCARAARRRRGGPDDIAWESAQSGGLPAGARVDSVGGAALPARRVAARRGVIDTHAHLQGLPEGPDAAIDAAAEAGVDRIVCVGDSPELAREALELCDRHPRLRTTAGLHPHRAEQWNAQLRDELAELVARSAVVAIGECGLDFYRERAPHDVQARAFEGQVELAAETGQDPRDPHARGRAPRRSTVLRGFGGRVVLHCFALPDELDEVIERGWWTSFAGNVTYPSAVPLQEAARRVPVERLLVETDSPYLAPVPHRGRPCRPAMVLDTLRFIAGLRGVEPDELARAVVESADAAFALPA